MAASKSGKKEVVSKRTERGALSAEAILRAALAVVDSDGLDGLTVRKMVSRLDVSPMAVYRYFRNKAEIVDKLVDLVVSDYDVTNHEEEDLQDWLRTTFSLMRDALCSHPGIIPLLGNATFAGSNAMSVMERILTELRSAGLSQEQAPQLFHLLMVYTVGFVALETASSGMEQIDDGDSEESQRHRRLTFEGASLADHPTIVELAPYLAQLPTDDQFLIGLNKIIASEIDA
jgi:AcrR family transcriptional regulator